MLFSTKKLGAVLLGATLFLSIPSLLQYLSENQLRPLNEIRELVEGLNASQVILVLGEPDTRQRVFRGERWVWWRSTYLESDDFPPEKRGLIGHLEIFFRERPEAEPRKDTPDELLEIDPDLGVRYLKVEKNN